MLFLLKYIYLDIKEINFVCRVERETVLIFIKLFNLKFSHLSIQLIIVNFSLFLFYLLFFKDECNSMQCNQNNKERGKFFYYFTKYSRKHKLEEMKSAFVVFITNFLFSYN